MKRDHNAAWLRKLATDTQREKLRRARAAVDEARDARRTARARARFACKKARGAVTLWVVRERERLRVEIERLRSDLRKQIDARRASVRKCCGPDKRRTREEHDAKVAATRETLEQLRQEHRRARIWTKPDDRAKPARATRLEQARQRYAESNDAVEANLSPDELIVWRKVHQRIQPSSRASRLEQFQHWLHDHAGEVGRILEEDAQHWLQKALKDQARERKGLRSTRGKSARELAELVRGELDAVPF